MPDDQARVYAPIRGDKHVTFEVEDGRVYVRFRELRGSTWVYRTPKLPLSARSDLDLQEPWEAAWTKKGGGHAIIRRKDYANIELLLDGSVWAESTNYLWGLGLARLRALVDED